MGTYLSHNQKDNSLILEVAVVPRAKQTKIIGSYGYRLKIALAAPPVDGKANEVLTRYIAETLGLPQRAVSLVHGETSRQKRLRIEGMPLAAAAALLQSAISTRQGK